MKQIRVLLYLGFVCLLLTACNNSTNPGDDGGIPIVVPDFTIDIEPGRVLVFQGGTSEVVTVTVEREGFFTGPIELSVRGLPPGVGALISDPGTGSVGEIVLEVSDTTPVDDYALEVIAASPVSEDVVETELVLRVRPADGDAIGTAITGVVQTANATIGVNASSVSSSIESLGVISPETFSTPYVPGQILVEYAEPEGQFLTQAALEQREETTLALQTAYSLTVLDAGLPGEPVLLGLPERLSVPEAIAQLQTDPRVKYAEPNYYLYTAAPPNDPYLNRQWALAAAGVPVAWQVETGTGNRVVVAVLDSGFDLNHEDLTRRFLPGIDFCPVASGSCPGQDDTRNDADPTFGSPDNFHGTHVAGIIAALGNNATGIAGVAFGDSIKILPVKIFNDQGAGATSFTFTRGIRWSVGLPVSNAPTNPNPARIINLSVGGFFDSDIIRSAVADARKRGAIVIAAAGNNGINGVMAPASAPGVIGVGSVNQSFRRSCFSNYGTGLDIVAPGGDGPALSSPRQPSPSPNCNPPAQAVYSTVPQSDYRGLAGTSMATPMVSGVAALLLSQRPNLSLEQLEERLLASAYFDDTYMSTSQYGSGILRADLALGLPGPGDSVSITAEGASTDTTRVDTVVLDLYGSSSRFVLDSLVPDTYLVAASATGTRGALSGQEQVSVQEGETESVVIKLAP